MEKRVKRLGRVTWQRDRFVALRAAGEGMVATKSLLPPESANGLEVNADAAGGQLRVELCESAGRVFEGFTRENCLPLSSDELRWKVKWNSADISTIICAVKLRVFLNSTRIYSFSFGTA